MTALAPAVDERPLVRAILAGDEAAFADLVRRHSASLLHVARSFVYSRAEAEDGLTLVSVDDAVRAYSIPPLSA